MQRKYEQIVTTSREIFLTSPTNRDGDVLAVFHYESNQRISGLRNARGMRIKKNWTFYYSGIFMSRRQKQRGDCITWAFRLDKFLRGRESTLLIYVPRQQNS